MLGQTLHLCSVGCREGVPIYAAKDTILKLAGIANRFWQVVTRGLFSGVYTELQSVRLKSFQFAHILAVHLRSERLSGEKPGLRGFHLRRSDSFALQSLTAHLKITNSASLMQNKGDTLCFEEIDPARMASWMSAKVVMIRLRFCQAGFE